MAENKRKLWAAEANQVLIISRALILANLSFQPRLQSAEKVDVQQVQAIHPRATMRLVRDEPLRHETFKDARAIWLNVVMVGLLLLAAASALAIVGARHDPADALLTKLR